jgi:hypothetical protein
LVIMDVHDVNVNDDVYDYYYYYDSYG